MILDWPKQYKEKLTAVTLSVTIQCGQNNVNSLIS